MEFLIASPLWLVGAPLLALLTLVSMTGPLLVRHWVPLERLRSNNEVAGFKFAVVGVLYAVLLAFAVIVVWEKFAEADNNVAREAGAAVTIYRLAEGVGGEPGAALHDAVGAYLRSAIEEDWPAMGQGHESPATTAALDQVYVALLRFQPADDRGQAVMTEVLNQLDQVSKARRARLVMVAGIVPDIVWVVLVFGALVTIGFTFFFGASNLRAQSVMTGALASLIFASLLIIIAIDQPFTGTVEVEPDALAAVLQDFGGRAPPAR